MHFGLKEAKEGFLNFRTIFEFETWESATQWAPVRTMIGSQETKTWKAEFALLKSLIMLRNTDLNMIMIDCAADNDNDYDNDNDTHSTTASPRVVRLEQRYLGFNRNSQSVHWCFNGIGWSDHCTTVVIIFIQDPSNYPDPDRGGRFFLKSGLEMIQIKIQFKTESKIFIQENIHSKQNPKYSFKKIFIQ